MKNLWTKFFKAKYVKFEHLSQLKPKPTDSHFWKSILRVLVNDNCYVKVCEGNISFWFDQWLNSEPLAANGRLQNPKLLVKDCWHSTCWDVEKIIDLLGKKKEGKIIQSTASCKPGQNIYIWKPVSIGNFIMHLAWELVRSKEASHEWL